MTLGFKEIIYFFAEKMHALPPEKEIEQGIVELYAKGIPLLILSKPEIGGLTYEAEMGFFLSRIPIEKLKILSQKNYLGIETLGNALCIAQNGITLKLVCTLSAGGTTVEFWQKLSRFLDLYVHLMQEFKKWPEFTPIVNTGSDDQTGSVPNYHSIKG